MNFTIPDFDFTFEDVVIKKAKEIIKIYLHLNSFIHGVNTDVERIELVVSEQFWNLSSQKDRLIFIREIMLHMAEIKSDHNIYVNKNLPVSSHQKVAVLMNLAKINDLFDDFQYFLVSLLSKDGYNLDTNSFSFEEKYDLDSKIDTILNELDKLKAGQEVLFNEFEEVKSQIKREFESLKSEYPLGKKTYFQLALGKIGTYTGNKIADEIFEKLKPHIIAFLLTESPHLIDGFQKLIHQ